MSKFKWWMYFIIFAAFAFLDSYTAVDALQKGLMGHFYIRVGFASLQVLFCILWMRIYKRQVRQ